MAIPHAPQNEIIDVRAYGRALTEEDSQLLVRTGHLEIFRYALPAGKTIQEHAAAGVMVAQCIEGAIAFTAQGRTQTLSPGDLLWLEDGVAHSLTALSDASLLVTILLRRT
ncbi:MAG TPA: cupin domain-containing protein [Casimicrobiaceae bacterium]|jgi:quercetin dioxygenase-like cupin family protein|nr:cupin domain-containing protein [Casimicrobiaceae bacterium]